jgi:hypothetical protein
MSPTRLAYVPGTKTKPFNPHSRTGHPPPPLPENPAFALETVRFARRFFVYGL